MAEHEIQTALYNYLSYIGCYVWRNNTGLIPQTYTNKYGRTTRRMIRMGIVGMPDLLAVMGPRVAGGRYTGRLLGVEVKQPNKKPTPIQELTHEQMKHYGSIVWVIHSVDELKKNIDAL